MDTPGGVVDTHLARGYPYEVRLQGPAGVRIIRHDGMRVPLEEYVKTYHAKPGEVQREWLVVDATDIALGRLASRVATILRGKHKPQYTPHIDTGDYVIVVNAEKIKLTGNKAEDKVYYSHSGYPGGLKAMPFGRLIEKRPALVIEKAVKGMLPKNTLGRAMGKKLKVYAGPEHPHAAQSPRNIELEA